MDSELTITFVSVDFWTNHLEKLRCRAGDTAIE